MVIDARTDAALIRLFNRFSLNIQRTFRLIEACTATWEDDPQGMLPVWQDVARSAVVFLHASLEDFLRGLATCKSRRDRNTFNNTREIEALLTALGIDYSNQREYLPRIESMMRRRHRIVHHADLPMPGSTEPTDLTLDDVKQLTCWFADVDYFASEIVIDLLPEELAKPISMQLEAKKQASREWRELTEEV